MQYWDVRQSVSPAPLTAHLTIHSTTAIILLLHCYYYNYYYYYYHKTCWHIPLPFSSGSSPLSLSTLDVGASQRQQESSKHTTSLDHPVGHVSLLSTVTVHCSFVQLSSANWAVSSIRRPCLLFVAIAINQRLSHVDLVRLAVGRPGGANYQLTNSHQPSNRNTYKSPHER